MDDDSALAVLNDRGVSLPREHVFRTLWRYVWPIWREDFPVPPPEPRADVHHCVSPYRQIGWVEEGWCGKRAGHYRSYRWSNFCSEECRIRSVCESFFSVLGRYP